MWVKLLIGDCNLNNITIFLTNIVDNHIEENKTCNSSKIEHIF
jgi:hypothetical protein